MSASFQKGYSLPYVLRGWKKQWYWILVPILGLDKKIQVKSNVDNTEQIDFKNFPLLIKIEGSHEKLNYSMHIALMSKYKSAICDQIL